MPKSGKRSDVSLDQLAEILTPSSPEERERLVSTWRKATIKQRREWLAWAAQRRGAGSTVREFLREVARKEVPTREVIMFANFEFEIRRVEDTAHGGRRFDLNGSEYLQYLRYGRPYPRGKQLHLSQEERRIASPSRDEVKVPILVDQGDELVEVGIADERAVPPDRISPKDFLLMKLPRSTESRWVPKVSYPRHLHPYHQASTVVPSDTFLRFQTYIRGSLQTIVKNPTDRLPLPPTVPKEEAERKDSPWKSRFPKEGTYCHYMLLDLREIRQTKDAYKVKWCDCGNLFLQHTPKQRFCQPQCGGRSRIVKLRRARSTPKKRKR